jgi:hypothetical protein
MIPDPDATQDKINPTPTLSPDVGQLKKNAAASGANLFNDSKKNTRDYGKPKFFEGETL